MKEVSLLGVQVIDSAWHILLDSSPFIIFGFIIAGLLKAFLPDDLVGKHLGEGRRSGVVKSALIGIPLPLCSCGVLPAAAGLREQGADKGAVSSFMIATPETGVDSIAITYALLDPLMAVIRPFSAFITAVTTGLLVNLTGAKDQTELTPSAYADSCCSGSSCCSSSVTAATEQKSLTGKLKTGLQFSFGDLIDDIGGWLVIGVLLAGIISVFVSPQMVETYLGSGLLSMLFMLVLATPLYVCATASTPIAAALVLKGVSPGAALVFLLAGPATNVATITVVAKVIGKKATAIYVFSILVCSLMMGLIANQLYRFLPGANVQNWQAGVESEAFSVVAYGSTLVLMVFIMRGLIKKLTSLFIRFSKKSSGEAETPIKTET